MTDDRSVDWRSPAGQNGLFSQFAEYWLNTSRLRCKKPISLPLGVSSFLLTTPALLSSSAGSERTIASTGAGRGCVLRPAPRFETPTDTPVIHRVTHWARVHVIVTTGEECIRLGEDGVKKQPYSYIIGHFEVNAFSLCQQRKPALGLPLEEYPIVRPARSDNDLERSVPGESLIKELVDLYPAAPVLRRW